VGGDFLRKLLSYLHSVSYPLSEEEVKGLIRSRNIPHKRLLGDTLLFNLDHVDTWIKQQRTDK
jgi:hypothetical protein